MSDIIELPQQVARFNVQGLLLSSSLKQDFSLKLVVFTYASSDLRIALNDSQTCLTQDSILR